MGGQYKNETSKNIMAGRGGVDWTDLAQDREKWQALVNMVIHFWVP